MENLLHILKLIKQTKCEKQAKLPSTLQSRYIQTQTHTQIKHTSTRRNANTEQQEKITSEGGKYTHPHTHTQTYTYTYSLIYTVITSCGGQSAAGTGRR